MRRALIALPLLIAACGDTGGDYPTLVPVGTLVEPALPAHAAIAARSPATVNADVAAAGAATRQRADAIASQSSGDAALLARAAALRARADALREADPGA